MACDRLVETSTDGRRRTLILAGRVVSQAKFSGFEPEFFR